MKFFIISSLVVNTLCGSVYGGKLELEKKRQELQKYIAELHTIENDLEEIKFAVSSEQLEEKDMPVIYDAFTKKIELCKEQRRKIVIFSQHTIATLSAAIIQSRSSCVTPCTLEFMQESLDDYEALIAGLSDSAKDSESDSE